MILKSLPQKDICYAKCMMMKMMMAMMIIQSSVLKIINIPQTNLIVLLGSWAHFHYNTKAAVTKRNLRLIY